MRKVLYIVSTGASLRSNLVMPQASRDQEISVLLIEDGVTLTNVPAARVFVLADDAVSRHVTPVFPTVSYQDMVRLIFEADAVIAL